MTDRHKTHIWEKYKRIAWKLAGDFSKRYSKPYHEMREAAEYALLMELFGRKKYQEQKNTKKSTWLYTVIYFHLTHVCTRGVHPCPKYPGSLQVAVSSEWSKDIPFSCLGDEELGPDPEDKPYWLTSFLTELGEEARALVRIVVEAPGEIADVVTVRSYKSAQKAIREYLIDELDWTSSQVDRAWAEVQVCLEG